MIVLELWRLVAITAFTLAGVLTGCSILTDMQVDRSGKLWRYALTVGVVGGLLAAIIPW